LVFGVGGGGAELKANWKPPHVARDTGYQATKLLVHSLVSANALGWALIPEPISRQLISAGIISPTRLDVYSYHLKPLF
jgi:hypothetical protein